MTFGFKVEEKDKYCIISVSGTLIEKSQAIELMEEVAHLLNKDENKFILDFSKMDFMNSAGMAAFLTILTKSRKAGGETILCLVPEKLNPVYEMTLLKNIFTVKGTIEEAVNCL